MLRLAIFMTAFCLAATPLAHADFEIGDSVLAYWDGGDGAYFVGTIVENKKTDYLIVFEDGDTADVSKNQVKKNDIKVGSKVIARWKDGQYYPASVAKIVGRALYVHYADGTKGWAPWSWIAVQKK